MKKTTNLLLILFSFVFLLSCDDEQFDASSFDYVSFEESSYFTSVNVGESAEVVLNIYASKVSGSARTFNVAVDATNTDAPVGSYQVPESITIPAGSNEASITVTLTDNNQLGFGVNTLALNLNNVLEGVSSRESLEIEYSIFCPVVPADLVGTYSGEGSWNVHFGYQTQVVTSLDGSGNLLMTGLAFAWTEGWWGENILSSNPVVVTFTSADGDFVIEAQDYMTTDYQGGTNYQIKATGKFNMCLKTAVINPVLITGGVEYNGTRWGAEFEEVISLN